MTCAFSIQRKQSKYKVSQNKNENCPFDIYLICFSGSKNKFGINVQMKKRHKHKLKKRKEIYNKLDFTCFIQ